MQKQKTFKSWLTPLLVGFVALLVIVATVVIGLIVILKPSAPLPTPVVISNTPTPGPTSTSTVIPTSTPEPAPILASVTGRVWHDLCTVVGGEGGAPLTPSAGCTSTGDGGYRANGVLEAGEPGIGGVLVALGAGTCPASGLATTATAADGTFSFTGLGAGTYCVSVSPLHERNVAILNPGAWTYPAGGIGSTTVDLVAGEQRTDVRFGWDYQFLPLPEPIPTQQPQSTPTPQPGLSPTPMQPSPTARCTDKAVWIDRRHHNDDKIIQQGIHWRTLCYKLTGDKQ